MWLGLIRTELLLSLGVDEFAGFSLQKAEDPEFVGRVIAALADDPALTVRDEAHEAFPRHGTHDGDPFGLLLTGCPLGVLDTGRGLQARGEKDVLGGVAHSVECVHAPDFAPLAGRVAGLLDELTLRCEH